MRHPFVCAARLERRVWTRRSGDTARERVEALLLAAMGVYAVISYSTTQRSHELAIRAALGAEPKSVAWLVLRQVGGLSWCGIVLALVMSALPSPLLARLLYDGSGWSSLQFMTVATVLIAVALVAAGEPALRAMRSDPMNALRAE